METKHTDTQTIENQIRDIFKYVGENPDREGLKDTPKRIIKTWSETLRGYDPKQKPNITLFRNKQDGIFYNEMITDNGDFYSYCEHHFLPFFGTYHFAYIPHPEGQILGLSKVARIVDFYAAKLQVQERLTSEIINSLWEALCQDTDIKPLGMILILKAQHLCKAMRGVKKKGYMSTIQTKGCFDKAEKKDEFLKLIKL